MFPGIKADDTMLGGESAGVGHIDHLSTIVLLP